MTSENISNENQNGELLAVVGTCVTEHRKKKNRITFAFGFLATELFGALIGIALVQYYYIPRLRDQGTGTAPFERAQEFIQAAGQAEWLNGTLLFGLVAVLLAFIGTFWAHAEGSSEARAVVGKALMRFSVVRSLAFDSALAASLETIGRTMQGGRASLSQAINLAQSLTTNVSVRDYWAGVKRRLATGTPVVDALGRPSTEHGNYLNSMLAIEELVVLSSHQNDEGFSATVLAIANERGESLKRNANRLVRGGMLVLGTYIVASIAIPLWLLALQNPLIASSFGTLLP